MWFYIVIFSIIIPAVLFIIGETLYLRLIKSWPGIVCWILALVALGVGLYFSISTSIVSSKEDIENPAPIVETIDYNYCPYCGGKIK